MVNTIVAFDNPLVREIQPRNFINQYLLSLYDISGNPALFSLSYPEDIDFFQTRASNQDNLFRRTYDPRRQEEYELWIHSAKHLSERITLVSGIRYTRTIQHDVYRSLEKNLYDEYFSYLDTTIGTTTFDGPQVNFLYDYALTKRLNLGIEINYGVEHSLKDIYTQCEIIARNTELRAGLSFISNDKKTIFGLLGTYYNAQRKYEAVKYLQDAFVRTLYGYHIFLDENPRTTNRKNDDREGYGGALQFSRRDFLLSDLVLTASGEYSGRSDNVTAGSVSLPTARGYWVSHVYRFLIDLNYSPADSKNSLEIIYKYRSTEDWAKAGDYNVIILDNEEYLYDVSLRWQRQLSKRLKMNTGTSFALKSCEYQEYTIPFRYQDSNRHFSAFLDVNLIVNQILSIYLLTNVAKDDLYFYWEADQANRYGCEAGLEHLTTFGRIGIGIEYYKTIFDNPDQYDQSIGLKILYWK